MKKFISNDNNKKATIITLILISILVFAMIIYNHINKPIEISYNDFLEQVKNYEVNSVYLNNKGDTFEFTNKEEIKFVTDNPKTENFREFLLLSNIEIVSNNKSNYVLLFLELAKLVFIIGFMLLLINKMGLSALNKQETLISSAPLTKFIDIAGNEEAKEDMQFLVNFLKSPDRYNAIGAKLPKGVVLYGPPGTGKTLTARAIAGEAEVPFFNISGSDFIEMYAGLGAKRVRELFAAARKNSPCIIFIDEIDAIGTHRGNGPNDSEKNQTINALLAELDGFSTEHPVVTIVATNRVEDLDRALVRPGRFDKNIAIELPDARDRLSILNVYAKNKNMDKNVDLEAISKLTIGFSGAALEALMNEAAILAVNENKETIDIEHINDAYFKMVVGGHKKKNAERNDSEIELIAYHEAGHALMSKLLTDNDVPKVTIVPSTTGMGGATFTIPKRMGLITKRELINSIKILYAGRASEFILRENEDDITSGASNDIKVATNHIKSYYAEYGMSEFGMIALTDEKLYIDSAMKLSNQLYKETLETLKENKVSLKRIATALIEKETINEIELNSLIQS